MDSATVSRHIQAMLNSPLKIHTRLVSDNGMEALVRTVCIASRDGYVSKKMSVRVNLGPASVSAVVRTLARKMDANEWKQVRWEFRTDNETSINLGCRVLSKGHVAWFDDIMLEKLDRGDVN